MTGDLQTFYTHQSNKTLGASLIPRGFLQSTICPIMIIWFLLLKCQKRSERWTYICCYNRQQNKKILDFIYLDTHDSVKRQANFSLVYTLLYPYHSPSSLYHMMY